MPGLLFRVGELGQGGGFADAGQVGVRLPVLEGLDDRRAGLGLACFEELGPGVALGLEPVEGLLPQFGPRCVGGGRVVLALAGGGQRRGAGGVVAVPGLAVVAELRVGPQGARPRAGRRRRTACGRRPSGRRPAARRRPWACPRPARRPAAGRPVRPAARLRRPTAPRGIASRAASSPARGPYGIRPATRRSRPCCRRIVPKLQWASAWSGFSRIASRISAISRRPASPGQSGRRRGRGGPRRRRA